MSNANSALLIVRPTNDDPDHPIENLFNSDWRVFWRTVVERTPRSYELVFDLQRETTVYGFCYLPPPYNQNGRIIDWQICAGDSLCSCDWCVGSGSFTQHFSEYWPDEKEKFGFEAVEPFNCRFVKFIAKTTYGNCFAAAQLTIVTKQCENQEPTHATLAHLKGSRMAPSVHLKYHLSSCRLIHGEMTIRKSTPGSYFMAIGFTGGYFGMQEMVDEKRKVILFSVWDSSDNNDPNSLAEDLRVKHMHKHPNVSVGRFGGEGTGGQSFYDFDWQLDNPYSFVVRADDAAPGRVAYSAYFFHPIEKQWILLVTFSTRGTKAVIENVYSFIEDFRRDFASFNTARTAEFRNFWGYSTASGAWQQCNEAQFTCDSNPNRNIDCGCGIGKDNWFLTTGGSTMNSCTLLGNVTTLPQSSSLPPVDILQHCIV